MGDESMTDPKDPINERSNDGNGPSTTVNQETGVDEADAQRREILQSDKPDVVEDYEAPARSSQQDKSDSEAETVVLPGKAQKEGHKDVKSIKLEDDDSSSEVNKSDRPSKTRRSTERRLVDGSRRSPLKRKRGEDVPKSDRSLDEHNSSDLSSNRSSPVPQARSSKTSDSRSAGSRSSAPVDDDGDDDDDEDRNGKLRKRTGTNERGTNKRRSSHSAVNTEPNNAHQRGERRVNHQHESVRRSPSPQTNLKSRVRSTQPNGSTPGVNKRRKPAPLYVDRRRKPSEDVYVESDDSSSVHSHHRVQRLPSGEGHAMSPAKISHKKNRDRSGRTLLARACSQQGGYDEALRWLKDHPQDIDVPDYAGNTPLQIASLAGNDKVVGILLREGCDTSCKNIDSDTPLIDAVENTHLGVVRLLLKAGVDPRQRNAKGQQPLELVRLEEEDGEAIRDALLEARKVIDATRRQSEDHRHGARDADTPSAPASGASPTESTRSPPPVLEKGGRKRTARSEQSDEALLWVNPTPKRLREEAGRGNLTYVSHILGMRPEAGIDAVIAAVKGGHDEVLGFMIAMAAPDPDPEPLHTTDQVRGHNTPMLAAIGRGNLPVVKLLLDQAGFDPTRRMFNNLTYPEIAVERKGDNWEKERDMLQAALDEHHRTGGHRSNTSSPRKVRKQRAAPKEESPEPPSSPQEVRKVRKSFPQIKEEQDTEAKRRPSYHGTAARQHGSGDQDTTIDALDRPHPRSSGPKPKLADRPRSAGNDTSHGPTRTDSIKPKRKLMSGNDLKTGQDGRRKSKPAEEDDTQPNSRSTKPRHRQSFSSQSGHRLGSEEVTLATNKSKKASSEEPARTKDDSSKKRMRISVSPQAHKAELPDAAKKKKKRQRVGSIEGAPDAAKTTASTPVVANMVSSSPTSIKSPGQGAAPVAFMGASTASHAASPTVGNHSLPSPITTKDQEMTDAIDHNAAMQKADTGAAPNKETEQEDAKRDEHQRLEAEQARQEHLKREEEAQRERQEAERQELLRREAEDARLEAQRQADEAERQAQLELEAEEARLAKAKRDEELQRRRIEEEKQRREDQERRRREREEREALRRIKLQEEEKRARMEALPNGLRRAAELGPERARDGKEVMKWLPLRTVTSNDLNPDYTGEGADEQWIANIQAAPLLANQDLGLSQYTAWNRLNATSLHVNHLWRQLRNPMSNAEPSLLLEFKDAITLDNQTKPKFFNLKIFWIKLSDFMDIVPRHPHLAGIAMPTRAMALNDVQLTKSLTPRSAQSSTGAASSPPFINGSLTNGDAQGTKP